MDYAFPPRSSVIVREFSPALRFGCVGLSGVVINMTLLWMFTEIMGLHYLLSSAIATEMTIMSNFFLNSVWTFSGHRGRESFMAKLLKFNAISLGGLVVTLFVLYAFTEAVGTSYLVSNVLAIASATGLRYVASRRWVWNGLGRTTIPRDEAYE
jgi:dolichol-phosphate mannosyltransferase